MSKGAVGNVAVGIAAGIGLVARAEGGADDFVLTGQPGPVGGLTSQAIASGPPVHTRANLAHTTPIHVYLRAGPEVALCSFSGVA